MSTSLLDIKAQGLGRLASQYSDRPNILAYIEALLDAYQELEDVFQFMALQTDIDVAEGVNLDIIGEIVGISRIIPDSIAIQFFGFEGQPGAIL